MFDYKKTIILCLFLQLSFSIFSQIPIVLNDTDEYRLISSEVLTFDSEKGDISFEEVRKFNRDLWLKNQSLQLNLNDQPSTKWLKFKVKNNTSSNPILSFKNLWIARATIYILNEEETQILHIDSVGMKFGHKNHDFDQYWIKLPESRFTTTIYCEMVNQKRNTITGVPLILGTENSILKKNSDLKIFVILCIGVMLAFCLFSLLTYGLVQESIYLYYTFYLSVALFLTAYVNGVIYDLFWSVGQPFKSLDWLLGLLYLSIILFSVKLLKILTIYPKHRFFVYAMGFLCLIELFPLTAGYALDFVSIVVPIYLITMAILSRKQNQAISLFYVIAWLPLTLASFYYIFERTGIFFNDFFANYSNPIGFTFEAIIFSFTLVYRYNQERKEKLIEQQKNLDLLDKYNTELEKEVEERTEEIRVQNEELLLLNEELHSEREELSSTNDELIAQLNRQEELSGEKDKIMQVLSQYIAGPYKRIKQSLKTLKAESDSAKRNLIIRGIGTDIDSTQSLIEDLYDENSLIRDSFKLQIDELKLSELIDDVLHQIPSASLPKVSISDDVLITSDPNLLSRLTKNILEFLLIGACEQIAISFTKKDDKNTLLFSFQKDLPESVDKFVALEKINIDDNTSKPLHIRMSLIIAICHRLGYKYELIQSDKEQIIEIGILDSNAYEQGATARKLMEDHEAHEIYDQILEALEEDKLFTNPELTLNQLSDKLSIHSKKISYVINLITGQNFSNLINQYRVDMAKKLLIDPQYAHLSYLAIGFEAGFNSKSTFYSTFKKFTNSSPKEFVEQNNLSVTKE